MRMNESVRCHCCGRMQGEDGSSLILHAGVLWCSEHESKGRCMAWGEQQSYPSYDCYSFIVGQGYHAWNVFLVCSCTEEQLALLEAAIEYGPYDSPLDPFSAEALALGKIHWRKEEMR